MVKASPELIGGFAALAILVAASLPLLLLRFADRRSAARAAALAAVWLAATFAAAASGRLRFDTVPPTMAVVLVASFALALRMGTGPTGTRLAERVPLALLVGIQGFRLPLELLLHRAYGEGLMPVQMSYSGRNFDIVTGISALLLAAWIAASGGRVPRWVVGAWNAMGALLLANVVTIAILSSPVPFRVFMNEPSNVWITQAPWVWLPCVFVFAAIAGHVVVFRRLRMGARATSAARRADAVPAT